MEPIRDLITKLDEKKYWNQQYGFQKRYHLEHGTDMILNLSPEKSENRS